MCCKNFGCSYFWCSVVTVLDVSVSIVTLGLWTIALYQFKWARDYLELSHIAKDVAWYVMISLPIVAFIGLWNGFKLFGNLRTNNFKTSFHILKAIVFFIVEGAGYAVPFFIFEDYMKKITYLSVHPDFIVFRLMEVNPVTIALFVYQIVSFFVVYWHKNVVARNETLRNQRAQKKFDENKARAELRALVELPPYSLPINDPITTSSNSEFVFENAPPSAPSAFALVPRNNHSSPMYPDLNDVQLNMMTLASNYVINIEEHEAPLLQRSSRFMDSTEIARYGTESTFQQHSRFHEIKQSCLSRGVLYEDPEFTATSASLQTGDAVQWKRPFEIRRNARFFTDGVSRFDVRQGALGDCWFLAAMANLTLNEKLFYKVVPRDNEWAGGSNYAGVCHFWFYDEIKWKEVIIDDRLPTKNGKLVYLSSTDENEFWSALLEKAYAKLNGSYGNLDGNDGIGRAMVNFTGGVVTRFMLNEFHNNMDHLYKLVHTALGTGKMVGCCKRRSTTAEIPNGHAYSITHISKIRLSGQKPCPAIRIRNPWGNKTEWRGQFGDSHPAWEFVDAKTKKALKLIFRDDGEFWFPLDKLAVHFDFVEVCAV